MRYKTFFFIISLIFTSFGIQSYAQESNLDLDGAEIGSEVYAVPLATYGEPHGTAYNPDAEVIEAERSADEDADGEPHGTAPAIQEAASTEGSLTLQTESGENLYCVYSGGLVMCPAPQELQSY